MKMVPTYLSHSYRAADRLLNETICEFFSKNGLGFTVDPKSGRPTIAQLEVMMRRSAAFVAVAPYRADVEYYRTSPFIVYECGLAQQARRPMLVFAETGVSGQAFASDNVIAFDRATINETLAEDARSSVRVLLERSRPDAGMARRTVGTVGLVLPATPAYRAVLPLIIDVLKRAGYQPEIVDTAPDDHWRLLIDLERHDFVVTDIGPRGKTGWLYPLMYGRFIPTVKLVHTPGRRSAVPALSAIVRSRALKAAGSKDDVAICWATESELSDELSKQVNELQGLRTQFQTLDEGLQYFRSLDRKNSGPVFLSNADEDNELARDITRLLKLYNIEVFHYVFGNPIEKGVDFAGPLLDAVATSVLFIPLITDSYWSRTWCLEEFDLAVRMRAAGRLSIIPYFVRTLTLEAPRQVPMQGVQLVELDREKQSRRILEDVDQFLTKEASPMRGPQVTIESQRARIDVAIITILPEEYAAVRERLSRPVGISGSPEQPNKFAWEVGEVMTAHHQYPYRVVVGLAGGPGTSGGLVAVTDTVRAFRPAYVLLVGIAGGLQKVGLGDVVVSDYIYGYEYAKVDNGRLIPRTNWLYRVDTAIVTAATTMRARFPTWHQGIQELYSGGRSPQVVVGPVASGNKVIDDPGAAAFAPVLEAWPNLVAVEMEGVGAAEAVRSLQEDSISVNFGMIRGISDLPTSSEPSRAMHGNGPSSQTTERDNSKELASAAAAECAFHLLREGWPVRPISPR